ncbi:MAG TPA: OmpA family protein [Thermoanaerobaculia bacterium]|nr:OmpA family protein [Thermoanaerobaculia bacterium]
MRHTRIAQGVLAFLAATLALFLISGCAGTKPEPTELRDARLAIQDARSAGAQEGAPDLLSAAQAHLTNAENTFKASGDVEASVHYARLAETEARDAQYRAITRNARAFVEAGTRRRAELEVAVRDAEIKALAARAQSDAERARLEAEVRARAESERMEAAARAREAEQQAADERVRALQAQLDAERQKAAEQQQQAQMESLRAQIEEQKKAADAARRAAEEQVAAARRTADAERARADLARRDAEQAAAREKTQGDLLARLQAIERSARVEARGIVLTLPGSVYFDTGRADVKKGAAERVARIGEALAGAPERKLIVEGHTDSTGSAATNEKLSALRAEAVKAILVAHGVSPDRIETHGYAATKPVASNATPAGRSENRRVELVVQGAVR